MADLNTFVKDTTIYARWDQTVKESYLKNLENQISNPDVKSNDGYWQVSYDGGKNWEYIKDTNNENVKATGNTGEQGEQGDKGDKGDTGISITEVKLTGTEGLVDTYTIAFSNGSTSEFTVTNGEKGDTGDTGITPKLKIGDDNYWYVSYDEGQNWTSLNVKATGEKGGTGETGQDGKDGVTPQLKIENGVWNVSYDSGANWRPFGVKATGDDGVSITKVERTGTEGKVDTYTITYSNGKTTTYTVTNGKDGEKGEKGDPGATGATGATGAKGDKGDTGATGATGAAGKDGVSIVSVTKTATEGLVDTYTITLSNGTTSTFTVTNGKDGITPQIKTDGNDTLQISYDNGITWQSLGVKVLTENSWLKIEQFQVAASSVTNLKAAPKTGKKVKITWKAPKGISGLKYQVKYQKKGSKKWTAKTTSKKTLTVKNLKKNAEYRFKVRGYKKIGGKTIYTDYDTTSWVKVTK